MANVLLDREVGKSQINTVMIGDYTEIVVGDVRIFIDLHSSPAVTVTTEIPKNIKIFDNEQGKTVLKSMDKTEKQSLEINGR